MKFIKKGIEERKMSTNIIIKNLIQGNFEEVTIDEWLKKEGDEIKAGDVLANVMMDKAVVELVSPVDGKIQKIYFQDGETTSPDDIIAVIAK
jgi:pyruvate dehydrogenase E2 component (dihydrolipoamide acetyltransferase)